MPGGGCADGPAYDRASLMSCDLQVRYNQQISGADFGEKAFREVLMAQPSVSAHYAGLSVASRGARRSEARFQVARRLTGANICAKIKLYYPTSADSHLEH